MGANKTKFTAEIEIKALLSKAEREMANFSKGLKSAWQGSEPPKGMLKAVEDLRARLESLRMVAAKGAVDYSDLKIAKGDYKAFTKTVRNLKIEFGLLTEEQKLAMLSKQEQENIKAREAAMSAYTKAVRKNTEEQKKNQEQLASAKASKAEKEQKVSATKAQLDSFSPQTQQQAEEYAKSLKEISDIDAKILEQEKLIDKYRKQGLSDSPKANNKLTQTIDAYTENMAAKQSKQAAIDANTIGKAAYDSIAPLREEIDKTNLEITELDENIAKIENSSKKIGNKTTERFEELKDELSKLGVTSAKDAKSVQELRVAVSSLKTNALAGVDTKVKEISKELDTMGDVALSTGKEIDAAFDSIDNQKAASAAQEQFTNRIRQFLGLSGAAQVLRSSLRNAMATITELDATMAEMAVVTDTNIGGYWDQLPEYTERANKLGLAIGDVYKADTLFYQQGLKTNEVVEISTETMKMAAIAGLDTATATDRMTAALRGFNMELNEASAQKVSDVYSELAAITAADVDEISSAMTKTASIASSAGMEFETTAAFLSQIIETTRESAETAGTAMKTIVARFQELKKSPDEIGEIDGEIVDANAIEGALRSVGVALRDNSGQFRKLDDVFLELSGKWSSLDKNTQRYIATIAAGSRQQSRFIAMMSNYKRTQELVTAANTSAGASQKQFEKTTESLEFKINKLKNAWNEFTMGIMNSDLVKMGVDILTKFLEVVNKATGALDGVGGSLTKIISIVGIFKLGKQIFEKFMPTISGFFSKIEVEAGESGMRAGQKFWKNFEDAKNGGQPKAAGSPNQNNSQEPLRTGYYRDKNGRIHGPDGKFAKEKDAKRTMKEKIADKTIGLSKWQEAGQHGKNRKKELEELNKLKEGTKEYAAQQKKVLDEGQKQWNAYAQAVGQVGQATTFLGGAMSATGGILSSLGLDDIGETLSQIGNVIMLIGSGVTALGPVIVKLIGTIVVGGTTAQIAWSWIALIGMAIMALIVGITAIVASVDTAEKRLKRAEESAEKAAEAADQAKESYENLSSAMDGLKEHYKTLDGLTKGTKEWNEQLRNTNSAVMDLIKDYPELAQFVSNQGGVLTIDMDSKGVQDVLNKAYEQTITTANLSVLANTNVASKQLDVDRKNLKQKNSFMFDQAKRITTTNKNGSVTQSYVSAADGKAWDQTGLAAQFLSDDKIDEFAKGLAKGRLTNAISGQLTEFANELEISAEELKFLTNSIEDTEGVADAIREYGDSIINLETQQAAMYDGLASSIVSLVDTMGKSEEQIKQMYNLADGDMYDKLYKEMESKFDNVDFRNDSGDGWGGIKEASGLTDEQIAEAFERAGFKNASYSVDTGKITYDDGNIRTSSDISKDQMVRIFSDYWATEGLTQQAEDTPAFTNKLIADATSKLGPDVGEALAKALQDESGKNLTQADITALSKITDWETLVSGTGYTNFTGKEIKNKVSTRAAQGASNLYAKSNKMLNDLGLGGKFANISSGALESFATKLTEASTKANGEANAQAVVKQVEQIIQEKGLDATQQESLVQRINLVDWSNAESWLAFQLDLEKTYGYSKEEAETYKNALIDATWATSGLTTTIQEFGGLYQATKKVNEAIQDITQAQWEYERVLKNGGDVGAAIEKLKAGYTTKAAGQKEQYNSAKDDLSTIYAQGATAVAGIDLRKYATFNPDGTIDDSRWQELVNSGDLKDDKAKEAANNWLQQLNDKSAELPGYLNELQGTLSEIEALEQEGKDAYYELRDMAKEALTAEFQEQIDLQQQLLDATNEAKTQLVNKIQEQINEQRQQRQNEEAEQNIADLRAQQAYLGMDTSGGNALQMLDIEEQITQAEQDYQDTLIDQSIQSLQDANDAAAEQRERQISLAEQSLEIYTSSKEFQAHIDSQLNEMLASDDWKTSTLGTKLITHFTEEMGVFEADDWISSIGASVGLADAWKQDDWSGVKTDITSKIDEIKTSIEKIGPAILESAEQKRLEPQKKEYAALGFNTDKLDAEQLSNIQEFLSNENQAEIERLQAEITKNGGKYASSTGYYTENSAGIASGQHTKTYAQFLQERAAEVAASAANKRAGYIKRGIKADAENDFDALDSHFANYMKYGGTKEEWNRGIGRNGIVDVEVTRDTSQDKQSVKSGKPIPLKYKVQIPTKDGFDDQQYEFDTDPISNSLVINGLTELAGANPQEDQIAAFNYKLYLYARGAWHKLLSGDKEPYLAALRGFKTGGLADFTGPAWLDGTPSKPEYILNSAQTERFFSLIDVLENYKEDNKSSKPSGDNYFDINIQVEKLENDYDVEKVADKIRRMIYEDASYRNVNAINLIR